MQNIISLSDVQVEKLINILASVPLGEGASEYVNILEEAGRVTSAEIAIESYDDLKTELYDCIEKMLRIQKGKHSYLGDSKIIEIGSYGAGFEVEVQYWFYGEYETDTYIVPYDYLTNPNWEEELRDEVAKENEEKELKNKKTREEALARKEEDERYEYERLKKKFEKKGMV